VSELGDVLELMHGARGRYSTLRATIREWQHLERSARAFERHVDAASARGGSGSFMVSYGFGAEQPPEATEALIRLWVMPPAKVRMERTDAEAHTFVTDGEREWSYSPSTGAMVNPAGGSFIGFEHLTDPALVLGRVDLEPIGGTSVAGRAAIRVRAIRRRREWHEPSGLPEWADHHDFAVDAERGVLLRAASVFDGEEFQSNEVREIAFDESFPDGTFVFTPPPGEEIRDAETAFPPPQHVTIDEAARLAPFTVLLPRRLPEGAMMHLLYNPGSERVGAPVSVHVTYWFEGAGHSLSIGQTREPQLPEEVGWETRRRDGTTFRVHDQYGQRHVVCERHGTHVMVTSDLDLETLIEIALSLEPAPTEPPRLVDASEAREHWAVQRRPRVMKARALVLGLAAAGVLALAACGGTVPESEAPAAEPPAATPPVTDPPATSEQAAGHDYDTDPTAVVLDLTTGGGFVPIEIAVDGRPDFRLYGDGTVLARPENETVPGPPMLLRYRLTPEGIQMVLAAAEDAGLLAEGGDYGDPAVTDLPTTWLAIAADGASVSHSAYALDFVDDPTLTAAQREARQRYAGFAELLGELPTREPDALAEPPAPYEPEAADVYLFERQAEPGLTAPEWPFEQPPAAWPPPSADSPLGAGCRTVRGAELSSFLAPADGEEWTPLYSDEAEPGATPRFWSIGIDLVLPGETGCEA
jgi:hypothetical protein